MPVKLRALEKGRVLVVAPHPDDEVIAVGGNLALHQRLGSKVLTLFVTLDTAVPRGEAERVARLLGFDHRFLAFLDGSVSLQQPAVACAIADAIRSFRPEVIYCPFPGDHHRDHQAASACTAAAVAETGYEGDVWCYELWSCLWPNIGVDISSVVDIEREAINCYASQVAYVDYAEGITRAKPRSRAEAGCRLCGGAFRFRPADVFGYLPDTLGNLSGGARCR